MKKPHVGQQLFRLNIGNNARHLPQVLAPVIVTKVGRKFFSAKTSGPFLSVETEYHLDSWRQRTEYTAGYMLYETEEQWAEEKEVNDICRGLWKAFDCGRNPSLSLDQLRAIAKICNIEPAVTASSRA